MARDYKPQPRRRRGGGLPGWVLGLGGLAVGLGVAAAVYFKDRHSAAPIVQPAATSTAPPTSQSAKPAKRKTATTTESATDATGAAAADDAGKSYDFYSRLPKFEVVVPEREKDVKPDVRGVPETRAGTYVLQAGSYKNFADADRVRAKLALQGVESKIQQVSVDNDTWQRIRIGPITNLDDLNRLRNLLRKADVDVLVIRVGD